MTDDKCPKCGAGEYICEYPNKKKWACCSYLNFYGEFKQSGECKDRQIAQQAEKIAALEEQKYQVYYFGFTWTQNPVPSKEYPDWMLTEDGKVLNRTSFYKMFRDETSPEQARIFALGWWNNYAREKVSYGSSKPLIHYRPKNVQIEVQFLGWETWCLQWFSHYTFNIHLSDTELLRSFNAFVGRKLPDTQILLLGHDHPLRQEAKEEGRHLHCLMGAEDRWRWNGPCRCEHCQEQGIVRIDH